MSSQVYNFGHAVTTDGSNIPAPVIDPNVIERSELVPVEFAHVYSVYIVYIGCIRCLYDV